jgi:CheY-like chemotaxis protein
MVVGASREKALESACNAGPVDVGAHALRAPGQLRLLIVEDHADTLAVMSRLLGRAGYAITTARSVDEALQAAAGSHFDLLLSDWELPDGNAAQILAKLRESGVVKAVVISGHGMPAHLERTKEAGFDSHLTKPIGFGLVSRAIR